MTISTSNDWDEELLQHLNVWPEVRSPMVNDQWSMINGLSEAKAFGQLVVLGFDVTVFTPAPYQRGSLPRPSMESSS